MIGGVGCDIVDITRFKRWENYSRKRLETLFSPQELIDCTGTNNILIPEKLAVRFAAKEAAYKAFSQLLVFLEFTQKTLSFRAFCKLVSVSYTTWEIPKLSIDIHTLEHMINQKFSPITCHLSFSHEKTMAMAVVIVEI
jgi:phosphopantetheine--protein transferase-like protein